MKERDIIEIEGTGTDIFVSLNGLRIAKRGDNRNWIMLVPGYRVSSPPDHSTINIEALPSLGSRRRRARR